MDTAWAVTTGTSYSTKATSTNMPSCYLLFSHPFFWGSTLWLSYTTKWHHGHYTWEGNFHYKNELPAPSGCTDLEAISEVPILMQALFCSSPSYKLVHITLPSRYTTMVRRGFILKICTNCLCPNECAILVVLETVGYLLGQCVS